MNIRSKILLSIVAGTIASPLAIVTAAAFDTLSVLVIAAIVLVFCSIAAVIGTCVANSIVKPLNTAVDMIHEMSRGHLGFKLNMNRGDEIGDMARALDTFADTLRFTAIGAARESAEIESGDDAFHRAAETNSLTPGDLNEVSRSIADMYSLILRNVDNSMWAKLLATESNAAVGEGETAVKRMEEAVKWIKAASNNNAKIVKMVNYMALRAKFLAFNAAIEAARAGDAGIGFAKVADEMRNFAIRCAEAAKNTTEMIDDSEREINDGVKLTEDVATSIRKIIDRADNVDGLINEIANVSDEQVQSITRVTEAVARMNPTVQRDAA